MPTRRSADQRSQRWSTDRLASADWTPRTFLFLGTFILASLGATALLVAFMLEGTAFARASLGVDGEAVTRRFYTAINDAVRTGDLSHLDSVIAGDIDDDGPRRSGTACDLRCRVLALHRLAPEVNLTIDEVLVDGDRVAARLAVLNNDRPVFLGLPLQGTLTPFASVEFLRIAGSRVVDAQPADGMPTLIEALAYAAIDDLPVSPFRLGLIRLMIEPGAAAPRLTTGGPALFLVESGALMVRVAQPASVFREARDGTPEREETAIGDLVLAPGDRLAVAAGTDYGLRSIGSEPAVVLGAATLAGDGAINNRWVRARPLDEILFTAPAPEYVAQGSPPSSPPPGVRSELLANEIVGARPAGAATLGLMRLTLPARATLPVHDARGTEILAVEDGTAIVELARGEGAIRPSLGTSSVRIWSRGGAIAHAMSTGGSVILHPGASAAVRNVGDEPLILLILTVEQG